MTGARGISRLPGQATVFYNGEERWLDREEFIKYGSRVKIENRIIKYPLSIINYILRVKNKLLK
jgi:hypothetical protein